MNSKVFLGDYIRCLTAVGWDINPYGKDCTCCGRFRRAILYDRNKSKKDGFDSCCKPCVSIRKAEKRSANARLKKKRDRFDSVIVGRPAADELIKFAEIFGAAMKEVFYEDEKTKTH